jgi:hypothetical protein
MLVMTKEDVYALDKAKAGSGRVSELAGLAEQNR